MIHSGQAHRHQPSAEEADSYRCWQARAMFLKRDLKHRKCHRPQTRWLSCEFNAKRAHRNRAIQNQRSNSLKPKPHHMNRSRKKSSKPKLAKLVSVTSTSNSLAVRKLQFATLRECDIIERMRNAFRSDDSRAHKLHSIGSGAEQRRL